MSLTELNDIRNSILRAQARVNCLEKHGTNENTGSAAKLDRDALIDVRYAQSSLQRLLELTEKLQTEAREAESAPVASETQGKYPYDQDFPFVVIGKGSRVAYARFRSKYTAERFIKASTGSSYDVIDTTPRAPIPEYAEVISWVGLAEPLFVAVRGRGLAQHDWTVNGKQVSTELLMKTIGDAEIEILKRREV